VRAGAARARAGPVAVRGWRRVQAGRWAVRAWLPAAPAARRRRRALAGARLASGEHALSQPGRVGRALRLQPVEASQPGRCGFALRSAEPCLSRCSLCRRVARQPAWHAPRYAGRLRACLSVTPRAKTPREPRQPGRHATCYRREEPAKLAVTLPAFGASSAPGKALPPVHGSVFALAGQPLRSSAGSRPPRPGWLSACKRRARRAPAKALRRRLAAGAAGSQARTAHRPAWTRRQPRTATGPARARAAPARTPHDQPPDASTRLRFSATGGGRSSNRECSQRPPALARQLKRRGA